MKIYILLLPMLLLASCSAGTPMPAVVPPSEEQIQSEESAVYSALLTALYPGQNVVLMDQTVQDGNLDSVLSQIEALDPETAASYRVRNDAVYPLDPEMALEMEFSLLSEEDMRELFNINQNGWDMFYSRYPDAPGITDLSRVGFNPALDQALVYIGTQSHWLAGAGYYVLMEKVEGIWTIAQQVMIWIS